MKQILLFLTTVILFSFFSFSQVNVMWESRYDNNSFDDYSKDIVLDNAGNSYVVGTSYNGTQFNIKTIKYDPNGNELWNVTHNGPFSGLDEAVGIVLNSSGDVIIAGNHQIGTSDYDIFAKKLSGVSGNTVWTFTYTGTANYDQLRDLAIDGNDNVILVGGLELGGANTDFITVSVNNGGTQNWAQTYSNTTNRDFASAVAIDPANNVYVTGESNSGSGLDYYTIKYNSAGAVQWSRRTDGAGQADRPSAIEVASDGNVYVAGASYRGLNDDDDIMLVKLNNAGGYVWDVVFGGSDGAADKARNITIDGVNRVYVVGSVKNIGNGEDYYVARYHPSGVLDWDYTYQSSSNGFDEAKDLRVSAGYDVYVSGYSNLTGSSDDYFTVKLDTSGNELWTERFNGPASNSDQMAAFEIDNLGNIFVTGSSTGSGTLRDFSTIKYCQLETIGSPDDTICIGESVQLSASGGTNFQWSLDSGDPITTSNFSCTNCSNPIASPSITSTYLVSSENGSGCIDYDTVTVVVNPLPGPNITANGPTSFCDGNSVDLTADPAAQYNWNTGENTQTITADTSGIYSLTVTDAMGCQNSTNINVQVFPNPVVDGGSDRFRCPGRPLTFNATGADSLVWFSLPFYNDTINDGESFIPPSTREYVVLGITPDGCEDRDTVLVTIYPNAPQVELTIGMSGSLFVNLNDPTTEWFQDGNALNHTGTSFYYDSLPYCIGEYTVEHTDENGCMSFDTIQVDTSHISASSSCRLGIEDYSIAEFSIYPNPTSGSVMIDFDSYKERKVFIHSSTGVLVAEYSTEGESFSFDLNESAAGSYLVTVVSDNTVSRKKIIKQ